MRLKRNGDNIFALEGGDCNAMAYAIRNLGSKTIMKHLQQDFWRKYGKNN